MTRAGRITAIAFVALTLASACGASSPGAGQQTVAEASPPPIPDDALALLPSGVQQLMRVDLNALRASEHHALLLQWARRMACIEGDTTQHWLLGRTSGLWAATYPGTAEGAAPWTVALLRGHFTDTDATNALAHSAGVLPAAHGEGGSVQLGRFRLALRGSLAASQLEGRWLLLGDRALVERVLAPFQQPGTGSSRAQQAPGAAPEPPVAGAPLSSDPALERAGGPAALERAPVVMLGELDSRGVGEVRRQLQRLGVGKIASGLSEGPVSFWAQLAGATSAAVRGSYRSPGDAHNADAAVRRLLSRANLFLRLAGLGSLLDGVRTATHETEFEVSLRLSAADSRRLMQRLDAMLSVVEPACEPETAVAAQR